MARCEKCGSSLKHNNLFDYFGDEEIVCNNCGFINGGEDDPILEFE